MLQCMTTTDFLFVKLFINAFCIWDLLISVLKQVAIFDEIVVSSAKSLFQGFSNKGVGMIVTI